MNNPSDSLEAPRPFLSKLFDDAVQPFIAAGFYYQDVEVAMHGVKSHRAIDFNVPRGTTVYAPADGWYVATFGERLLTDDKGQPKHISAKHAETVNNSSDLTYPTAKQPWPAYFGSYTIQGWHGQGRYTQYGHMDWVNEEIPYFAPLRATSDLDLDRSRFIRQELAEDLLFHPVLRANLKEYKSQAAFLQQGQILGVSGATGIGWNETSYDRAEMAEDGRPDFRQAAYTHYDAPYLHFMVFGRRYGTSRAVKDFWDPFGIYGTVAEYPQNKDAWPHLVNSLWLET